MKTIKYVLTIGIIAHILLWCVNSSKAGSIVLVATSYYDMPPAQGQGGSNLPLPNPWYGSSNTTYYGSPSTATNYDPDIGAILLENIGNTTVTLSSANIGGTYDLFTLDSITNPIQLLPNQFYILAGPDGSDVSFADFVSLTIDGTNYNYNDSINLIYYPAGVLHGFVPDNTDGTIPWTTIFTPNIINPPTFIGITNSNNTNSVTWRADFGQVYQLEYTTTLVSPTWTGLGPIQTARGSTMTFNDQTTSPQKFYRVVILTQ